MSRRDARHWKLSDEAMALMLEQVNLRIATLPYEEVARRTGMTKNSVRVTMWNLMNERRRGVERAHVGTAEASGSEQLPNVSST